MRPLHLSMLNPTLPLVALALRLSRLLHPAFEEDVDTVYVMNHTGEKMKAPVSNRTGVERFQEEMRLMITWKGRCCSLVSRGHSREVDETAMVYRPDYNSTDAVQPRPVLWNTFRTRPVLGAPMAIQTCKRHGLYLHAIQIRVKKKKIDCPEQGSNLRPQDYPVVNNWSYATYETCALAN